MHILPSKTKRVIQTYHIHGHNLEAEDSSKYLGVTLDNRLNWDQHINNAVMKGNRTLGFLRRNLSECTTQVKAATYTAIVRPTMEYASTVWDIYRQKHIKALEQVQCRAARYACINYTDRTPRCITAMSRSLQWDTLEERRLSSRLQMLYKIQHGLVDINKDSYMKQSDSRTRGANRLFQERTTHEVYYNSFFLRTIRDWNQLPLHVISANSLGEFRAGLAVSLALHWSTACSIFVNSFKVLTCT